MKQLDITALSHEGRGIATIDQKKIFIDCALPGETILCDIKKKHPRYLEGQVVQILNEGKDRVTPMCPHFGICGGCSLQHMKLEAQLSFKQQTVLEQLTHFGKVSPVTLLPPLFADNSGYRHRARLGVRYVNKKGKLLIGFREKNSRYLADINECHILPPIIGMMLTPLREMIAKLDAYMSIPQIEVAIGDEEAVLIFRNLTSLSEADLQCLITFGQQHHFHIYTQPNSPASLIKHWPTDNHQRLSYTLTDQNIRFNFHPLDFTQIHLPLNRLMINQALTCLSLSSQDSVLDLFCGIGNFTLPIAKQAHYAIGVEGAGEMVERAYENANLNHINNVRFLADNLMQPTITLKNLPHFNKILLDPPRSGAKEILPFIGTSHVEKIVYISCNPATLARDAGELVHTHGYQLEKIGIINMFPHTSHVETMAVFIKK